MRRLWLLFLESAVMSDAKDDVATRNWFDKLSSVNLAREQFLASKVNYLKYSFKLLSIVPFPYKPQLISASLSL